MGKVSKVFIVSPKPEPSWGITAPRSDLKILKSRAWILTNQLRECARVFRRRVVAAGNRLEEEAAADGGGGMTRWRLAGRGIEWTTDNNI
jgi:hypothetical protein